MRQGTREQTYTTVTAAICSGLSVIGSVYILGRYWYVRCMKARTATSKSHGGVRRVDVTQELIHVLAWLDLIGAFGRGFGSLPTLTYDQQKGEASTWECKLQAFAISFSDVSAITWNFLMAFNLFRWVCLGEDQQRLEKTIKWYILVALAAAATVTALALSNNVYGDAHVWCWISIPNERTRELYWKLWSLYIWILLLALAMCGLLILVNVNVRRRLEGVDNEDARIAYKSVVQTLTIYILAFIICWMPPLINRIYTYVVGRENFTLEMLHASIVSLQGFVNAIIYGKFHVWMARHLVHENDAPRFNEKKTTTYESLRAAQQPTRTEELDTGVASIFVTTFDMNWAQLPYNLDQWIPQGKDLYAFTLQHCTDVQEVEKAIREHLLRVNFPMGYRSITSLAGVAVKGNLEGASICQMVFVNNSDIASGNFHFQTADGQLWAQRKTNKNVLGIPIRYFDASIAFVGCSLRTESVSSPQQASRSTVLAAKNAATSTLVRSLNMGVDKSGVEFPHLYHHTILAGDLNYNIAKPQRLLTAAIDHAYRAQCLKRASDSVCQENTSMKRFLDTLHPLSRGAVSSDHREHRQVSERQSRTTTPQFVHCDPDYGPSRSSMSSQTSCDLEEDYEILRSKCADGVVFTELRSPRRAPTPATHTCAVKGWSPLPSDQTASECVIDVDGAQGPESSVPRRERYSWRTFVHALLPSTTPRDDNGCSDSTHDGHEFDASPQNRRGGVRSRMQRAQFADGCSEESWKELLQHDELLQAIQAKEVLCGFEEAPITFLPSYPRQVGLSASYSMTSRTKCTDLFADEQVGHPAYADRILAHSLPDVRKRIRNVDYWLCEEISTSTHKPVCSVYELEIDRFYAYKNSEASMTDFRAGNIALRDKTNVREFKIKLINLDANMWTLQSAYRPSMNPLRRLRSPSLDVALTKNEGSQSTEEEAQVGMTGRSSERLLASGSRQSMSTRFLDGRSRTTRRSQRDSLDSPQMELVPIEPSHIATVFPLPSEDVYALQRKVHEVAHSVQTGFVSSSRGKEAEEASLAFTNSRTVAWKEAITHGVTHSAIAKPVNGVLHIAISIRGSSKDQGGQGILCIKETDLVCSQDSTAPIPFDIPLTWGGKHVGYLHGDIVR